MLPIIHTYSPDRIKLARWGFWPEEWKRSKHSHTMINANPETTAEKPMFASSFRKTKANGGVSYSHERMSVILSHGRDKAWLPPHPIGMFIFPVPT